jgi:hypothetical protein
MTNELRIIWKECGFVLMVSRRLIGDISLDGLHKFPTPESTIDVRLLWQYWETLLDQDRERSLFQISICQASYQLTSWFQLH